jgi:geranylgeranyl pyrophosphate synthase
MFVGQSLDLDWTNNLTCPSIEEYLRMVDFSKLDNSKTSCSELTTHCAETGGLFRLLANMMISLSPLVSPPHIDRWTTLFGRYFQIRDDYQNLTSAEYTAQKGFAEDLDEGKYSLPLIHGLQSLLRHETVLLRNLLSQRRVAGCSPLIEHKTLILELMKQAGSLEFTERALRKLMGEIEVDMRKIEEQAGENPQLRVMAMLLAI